MSLKGSLQTVALPEVLQFLSGTAKSGELYVFGERGDGRLWFDTGRLTAFEAGSAHGPSEAIFELLRIPDGEFTFSTDVEVPESAHRSDDPGEMAEAVEAAQRRLGEWNDIIGVVPSDRHRVQLLTEVPGERVEMTSGQWALVVAVGEGHTVGEVIAARDLSEFEGFKAVRVLVDAALAEIREPDTQATEPAGTWDDDVTADAAPEGTDPVEVLDEGALPADALRFGVQPGWEPSAAPSEPEPAVESEPVAEFDEVGGGAELAEAESSPAPFGEGIHVLSAEEATAGSESTTLPVDQAAESTADDRYAALRAAAFEVGDDFSEDAEGTEGLEAATYQLGTDPDVDGRAALEALLTEVAEPGNPADSGPVDGLGDRGPWTEHELATMEQDGAWADPPQPPVPVPFGSAPPEVTDAADPAEPADDEASEEAPAEEPINRGLLLKFLSSVRN